MTVPVEYDLRAPAIGIIDLVALDTTEGVLRFALGDDGWFTDSSGNRWVGSRLLSCSALEMSIGGTAPAVELTLTFIQDPDEPDLVAAVKAYGVACIKGRAATFYMQYIGDHPQFFAPVFPPLKLTTRTMLNLDYVFEGPQVRRIVLTVEGPFALQSKPVGGRYNTADHSRRCGYANPSLEFMPTNSTDDEPLFGL